MKYRQWYEKGSSNFQPLCVRSMCYGCFRVASVCSQAIAARGLRNKSSVHIENEFIFCHSLALTIIILIFKFFSNLSDHKGLTTK